jgi:putative transposase
MRSPTWKGSLTKVATLLEDAESDILAFYSFPADHSRKLRSTNPLASTRRSVAAPTWSASFPMTAR